MKTLLTLLLIGNGAASMHAQEAAPQPGIVDRTALPIVKPVTLPPRTAQEATDKFLASKALLAMMKPVWSDEQIGRIIFIGWHNGAAALCGDLEVDSAKMAKAVASFAPADKVDPGKVDPGRVDPGRAVFYHDNLVLDIGLATGWVMGGNFRDLATFCAGAKAEMIAMPADHHLFSVPEADAAEK